MTDERFTKIGPMLWACNQCRAVYAAEPYRCTLCSHFGRYHNPLKPTKKVEVPHDH